MLSASADTMFLWLSVGITDDFFVEVILPSFLFPRYRKQNKEFYLFFNNVLGFSPRSVRLYEIAFTHKSKSQSSASGARINNERLEYLGDAVLGTIVADYLYCKFPMKGEGFLSELRSKIVSRSSLNKLAQKIGLSQLIQYDNSSSGLFKSKDGNGFEASIGAMYLDRGYKFTHDVVINRLLLVYLDIDALAQTEWNFKSKLIDWGQRERHKVSYEVKRVFYQGSGGCSQYDVQVSVDGDAIDHAVASSIKAAEQLASEKAYKKMRLNNPELFNADVKT